MFLAPKTFVFGAFFRHLAVCFLCWFSLEMPSTFGAFLGIRQSTSDVGLVWKCHPLLVHFLGIHKSASDVDLAWKCHPPTSQFEGFKDDQHLQLNEMKR